MEAEEFFRNFRKYFKTNPPSKGIYHYTDTNAFLGIMQNKEMWASHIKFMNDTSEGFVGYNHLCKILKYSKKDEFDESSKERLKKAVETELSKMSVFVISFTSLQDDLNQWRGYADSPNGLNIGFNANKISNAILLPKNMDSIVEKINNYTFNNHLEKPFSVLLKCLYDETFQYYLVFDILKMIKKNGNTEQAFRKGAHLFMYCAPFFKHSAFSDEKEWRLVIYCPENSLNYSLSNSNFQNQIFYRPGKSSIMPYVKVKIAELAINSITLAPSRPDKKIQNNSIRYFLTNTFPNKIIPISESTVPFRNW